MKDFGIGFVYNRTNRFSIGILTGAVESHPLSNQMNIEFLAENGSLMNTIQKKLLEYRKFILAFSFMTVDLPKLASLIELIRTTFSGVLKRRLWLIAGGSHASADPASALRLGFDIVCSGESEELLPALLFRLNNDLHFHDLKGINYCNGDQREHCGMADPLTSLDAFPPFGARHAAFTAIEITRGCPYACYFCQTSNLFGTKMRHRSIDNIARWASEFKPRRKPYLRLISPNAFAYGSNGLSPNFLAVETMLEQIKTTLGNGRTYFGSFPSEVRPEWISREMLELVVHYASNVNLVIGAQSGSDRMLNLAHRMHTASDVVRAAELTLKFGLIPVIDFIFGMPDELPSDRQETIKLIRALVKLGAIIHSHAFIPLPGSAWARKSLGIIDPETEQVLTSLEGARKQFGVWRTQIKHAKQVQFSLSGDSPG
jgi:B12-binding domain/radical SAM domain protein